MRYSAQVTNDKRCVVKDINQRISTILKALRQERGWSLDKAALATGVSKAMLGQIERGESSPTIATLWKIASGFETSFSSFIEESELNTTQTVHRKGPAQQLHPSDQKIRVMPLFPFDAQLHFELFILELLPGCEHLSPPHQHGVVEHVVVVSGTMEVFVDGQWHPLQQGEGLRFDADKPHGYRNQSHKMAIIHDIIHYHQATGLGFNALNPI